MSAPASKVIDQRLTTRLGLLSETTVNVIESVVLDAYGVFDVSQKAPHLNGALAEDYARGLAWVSYPYPDDALVPEIFGTLYRGPVAIRARQEAVTKMKEQAAVVSVELNRWFGAEGGAGSVNPDHVALDGLVGRLTRLGARIGLVLDVIERMAIKTAA